MKALILAASMALAAAPALARDGVPSVPQPPPSARTLPDACLGTSCPKTVDPGRSPAPCLGTSCSGAGSSVPGAKPGASQAPAPWSGPAQPRLPPMPSRSGQPIGPLTPGPALPR
ncbi:hypothetical protein CQ050_13490 [Achromobacter sp. MYb9]|nr:hypothetical protein CQ050_13490 [Achromobacter sp. MYb9]